MSVMSTWNVSPESVAQTEICDRSVVVRSLFCCSLQPDGLLLHQFDFELMLSNGGVLCPHIRTAPSKTPHSLIDHDLFTFQLLEFP